MKRLGITNRKTGAGFLAVGVLGFAVVVMHIVMWSSFKEFASNQISGLNYLSYFTYLANLFMFAWLVLTGFAILLKKERMREFLTAPKIFGGVALYVLLVGLIFYGFLRWMITPFPWSVWYARLADFFVHGFIPMVVVVIFIVFKRASAEKIRQRHMLVWLIFPLAYFIFSMIRGHIIDWYPYPFFDPNWEIVSGLNMPPPLYIALLTALFAGIFYLAGFAVMKIWNFRKP